MQLHLVALARSVACAHAQRCAMLQQAEHTFSQALQLRHVPLWPMLTWQNRTVLVACCTLALSAGVMCHASTSAYLAS